MRVRWALTALLLLGGCFKVEPASGTIKCDVGHPARLCPGGYSCVDQLCWKRGEEPQPDGGSESQPDLQPAPVYVLSGAIGTIGPAGADHGGRPLHLSDDGLELGARQCVADICLTGAVTP
jgi:hypothetical protein